MKRISIAIAAVFFLAAGSIGVKAEMTYTPINPSFGGYALNGSYLLSSAEAQNTTKDSSASSYTQKDPLESFEESLVRRIMSNLATKITSEAFGTTSGDLADGHYEFGDYSIDISGAGGENINVDIIDVGTGNSTSIEVPYY